MTPQQNKASILLTRAYDLAKGDNPMMQKINAKKILLASIDGLLTNEADRELIKEAAKKL